MNQTAIAIISAIIIFAGLTGSIVPFLPGSPLAFAGLLLYAIGTQFETVSVLALVILGVLTITNVILGIFGPALATKGYKSSRLSTWGAVIGAILGITVFAPVFGPLALFIGPFLGAFVGEYLAVMDKERALKAAKAALVGIIAGTIFEFAVSIAILAYFLVAVFRF